MKYTDYSKEAEMMRLGGTDCLSWIERFGVYLIDKNLYVGEPEKCDNVLVIRMKDNLLNAYYCYFYTNNDGETKFFVQIFKEVIDNSLLCGLFQDAHWNSESTQAWWYEVFSGGNLNLVDDSVLEHELICVDSASSMNMADFINELTEKIECGIGQLWNGKRYTVSKIIVGDDFATAQPLMYSLMKEYGCKVESFVTEKEIDFYDTSFDYEDVIRRFYIPWKFRNMQLNISPAMTLEQVAATSGISIPIPVIVFDKNTKMIKDVKLTDKPIAGYEDLDWKDLIANDDCADLQLDEYFFKDLKLCVIPDGYGAYYIGNVNDHICRIKLNR